MATMPKPDIRGLKQYDQVSKVPEQIASEHRRTKYDQVIADAKRKPRRLVFENDERATNVYVALRARVKRDKENLKVRKRDLEVYVFPDPSMKAARLSAARLSAKMGRAKIRGAISK